MMQHTRSLRRGCKSSKKVVCQALHCRTFITTVYRPQDVVYTEPGVPSPAAIFSSLSTSSRYPQTLTEKIVQRHSLGLPKGKFVRAGDYTRLSPSYIMTHDNSWPVALKFISLGASKVNDPNQLVMTLDHDVQNQNEANLKKYRQIQEFAKAQNVDFYPAGRGIGHQIMVEEGYAWPGTLAVASDSHSNMYGGIGCLGTPVVRTDAASIWATGWTWFQIPPQAKVTFTGSLPRGVTGKDIIVALCGLFSRDEVLNHAIEFSGSEETLRTIPVDARLTLSNMSTEWGALSGIFPVDSVLIEWLRFKATKAALYRSFELTEGLSHPRLTHRRIDELLQNPILADKCAKYQKELYLDLSTLCPYVSGPNSVKVATPLNQLQSQNIKIDKAYLVSCTNSRASDIAAAASVFREAGKKNAGKVPKIADHVQFYISAASSSEQEEAEEANDWQTLVEAGAIPLTSGCGPCIGLGRGILEPGEVGISASNRNFKGRMGSTEAQAYLSSPEVVAASALHGKITGPDFYKPPESWSGVTCGEGDGKKFTVEEALEKVVSQMESIIGTAEKHIHGSSAIAEVSEEQLTEILPGFPEKIEGEIVFCDADNLNTDSIYPGKYTYQDNVTREKMAEVCMSNYDPEFSSIIREKDILLSGFNFGCGSSREQAATAILATKIPLVVAGSFGNIFSRNSINNALPNLELPDLVRLLRKRFSGQLDEINYKEEITEPQGNRQSLDSPPPAPIKVSAKEKMLTRRTGLHLRWDVRRSLVEVLDSRNDRIFRKKVGEMPPNVQEIIACGGLENRVKQELARERI